MSATRPLPFRIAMKPVVTDAGLKLMSKYCSPGYKLRKKLL
jgi:hypothetical protein